MCSRGHCTPDRVYALPDFHGACGAVGKEMQMHDRAFNSVALSLTPTASLTQTAALPGVRWPKRDYGHCNSGVQCSSLDGSGETG